MGAIDRALDRPADRLARVVDEHVDVAVPVEHLADEPVDVLALGQVGRMRLRAATRDADRLRDLQQPIAAARDEHRLGARRAELDGGRLADAARRAGDDNARELLHGITFRRSALSALGADTRVPRRGAASEVTSGV